MRYSYQVLSQNRYINQTLEMLEFSLSKTKSHFENIPQVLEKMKKFKARKTEQNIKVQYLTFIQQRVFEFMASRNNGYINDMGSGALAAQ